MRVSLVRERRDRSRRVESTPTLPRVYFVPRGGKVVRSTAELRDDLCELRGELELLRRIRRRLASPPAPQRTRGTPSRNLDELLQILKDAQHPIVHEMTELLDREFPDIREEIVMTVINEEAENIVQEAIDCGAVQPLDGPSPETETSATVAATSESEFASEMGMTAEQTAGQIEAALAEAEAALAEVVGIPTIEATASPSDDVAAPPAATTDVTDPSEKPIKMEPSTSPEDILVEGDAPRQAHLDACEVESSIVPPDLGGIDAPANVEDPNAAAVAHAAQSATPDPVRAHANATDTPNDAANSSTDPASIPDSTSFAELYTPERAVQAVAEIEHGVRKLATLMSTEVHDQWRRASGALDELVHARNQIAELASSARASLDAILRIRAETQTARDDAEIVRREAHLLRDAAQRSKERAESAARAAEIAADQAAREVVGFPGGGTSVTQTLP